MLWHLGNTTVRTPYRLREALRALQGSPLNGNIIGREQENAFAVFLHNECVVNAPRIAAGEDASDLGRKWRVALSQLGFITPALSSARNLQSGAVDPDLVPLTEGIEGLTGRPFEITPNGYRLIEAEIINAQHECFLRSLASYRVPSPIESHYKGESFSPIRFLLGVFNALTEAGQGGGILTFQEYALYVQTASPVDGLAELARKIIEFREGRQDARGNVRAYDRKFYEDVATATNRKAETLDDYADLSFRYLKSTGLFRSAGRGLALSPARAQLANLLIQEDEIPLSDKEYLNSLWLGAVLPTDNAVLARSVVDDLVERLQVRGIEAEPPQAELSLPDLENKRHELEDTLLQLDEKEYADNQAECIDEIAAWMQAIPTRGRASLPNGDIVTIPKGEGPVYLEWIIWRAFLAIDSLINTPWEARRFQIDQDFLPVHCAPGRGPDMIFEFEDSIIVVEVTLTASSRQEAAEGEPVRRHVAQYVEQSEGADNKPVYGLFIALDIDSNTAHTFRSGDWYLPDDSKLSLDIVPITLGDFQDFFVSGRDRLIEMPNLLRQLLIECRAKANQDAPVWKQTINTIIQHSAQN